MPCDNGGRNGRAAAISKGMPRIAEKAPEARKTQERILTSRLQREHGPADILMSEFLPLEP